MRRFNFEKKKMIEDDDDDNGLRRGGQYHHHMDQEDEWRELITRGTQVKPRSLYSIILFSEVVWSAGAWYAHHDAIFTERREMYSPGYSSNSSNVPLMG